LGQAHFQTLESSRTAFFVCPEIAIVLRRARPCSESIRGDAGEKQAPIEFLAGNM